MDFAHHIQQNYITENSAFIYFQIKLLVLIFFLITKSEINK